MELLKGLYGLDENSFKKLRGVIDNYSGLQMIDNNTMVQM